MALQNRVDPWGTIFSSTARGTFMGNRGGGLHNSEREIVRQFNGRRWITCLLEFKGRQRIVMAPRRYTELFFLDEAVALAAGHRPCAECRRERFNAFRSAWKRAHNLDARESPLAFVMDAELHRARINSRGHKLTYEAPLNTLPDGCYVQIGDSSYLVWDHNLLQWAPEGYIKKCDQPDRLRVAVLTPQPVVQCLREGYKPEIHKSSGAL